MNTSYYQLHTYNQLEMVVCLEDVEDAKNNKGKFFIPAFTPFLDNSAPYDKKDPPTSTANIISGTHGLDIERCTMSNYIELKIPEYIDSVKRGDKFVISFIGGDINKPYIIGRYE